MAVMDGAKPGPGGIPEVTVAQAAAAQGKVTLLDVREQDEWNADLGHVAWARLVPLSSFASGMKGVDLKQPVAVICRSGKRSAQAAAALLQAGAVEVYNVAGGMMAWNQAGLPVERK